MRDATTLDVLFESPSRRDGPPTEDAPLELDETKTSSPRERLEEEEVPESEVPEEHVAPKPKRKPWKPKVPEVVPEQEEEEEVPVRKAREPKPKPRDPEPPEPVLTCLQVLQRGLAAAKATQKSERV